MNDPMAKLMELLRAGAPAAPAPWWRNLAAAALLLGGTGADLAGCLTKACSGNVPAVAPPSPQDPAPPDPKRQDPVPPPPLDAATAARVDKLLKDLEIVDRRTEASSALLHIGLAAMPRLDQVLASPATRAQPELLAAIKAARSSLALRAIFDLPPVPVTLFADWSGNRLALVDDADRELWKLDGLFGPWDAEFTASGTVLLTENGMNRVREVDRRGHVLWEYIRLKWPRAASRLDNGNTLIADTLAGRVIEVSPDKHVVWEYDVASPVDAERLSDGNTLIVDGNRVLEVSPAGESVWEVTGMTFAYDADRLPNGNTLITLHSRGAVVEVDREGKVVWELGGLSAPSDADRLPNGHTLVAENTQVREFDAAKRVVWRQEATWAVEASRF